MTKEKKTEEVKIEKPVENTEEPKELTLEEKITKLETELEEMKMNFLRARADYDNFRRRSQEELIHARDKAVINFVEDLLPAIDNFEMSLKMTDNQKMFVKGVEMIHKNLLDTLKSHKFESFSAKVGQDFDPKVHEPIAVESDKGKEGKVLKVLKTGIKHKDKIVRPVKVNVLKVE